MGNEVATLCPAFLIYLDGKRFTAEQEAAVRGITIVDRINAPSKAIISLTDPERAYTDSTTFNPGSEIKISLGYKDELSPLFIGEIVKLNAEYRVHAPGVLHIHLFNKLHRMCRCKKTRSFSSMDDKQIIERLADDSLLKVKTEQLNGKHLFTIQKDLTDFEYLSILAQKYGCFIWMKDNTIYVKRPVHNADEDVTLEWGKTLNEFNLESNSQELFTEVEVRGWDDNQVDAVKGKAGLQDIEKNNGQKKVKDSFGTQKNIHISFPIDDIKKAEALAKEILTFNARDYINAFGKCEGNTRILAGSVVYLKSLGKELSGKYFVYESTHRLDEQGYNTAFKVIPNLGSPSDSDSNADSKKQAEPAQRGQKTEQDNKDKETQPVINNLQWKKEGKVISKAHVTDKLTLSAVTRDILDGTAVDITIWEKDEQGEDDKVVTVTAQVKDGKLEKSWTVTYMEDRDDTESEAEEKEKGYTLPEYVFECECEQYKLKTEKSPVLQIVDEVEIHIVDKLTGKAYANGKYTLVLPDGSLREGQLNADGYAKEENIPPGEYFIVINDLDAEDKP